MGSQEFHGQLTTKLEKFLALAEDFRSLVKEVVAEGSKRLEGRSDAVTLRDRVLIGLSTKIYNSFESLVQDASASRPEAFHHLKTEVEAFFYFHWVAQDETELRAKLLLARATNEKKRFFEANFDHFDNEDDRVTYEKFETIIKNWTEGIEADWKKFRKARLEDLTRDVSMELGQWYNRIYKLACDPAHIGDLADYMPLPNESIELTAKSTYLKTPIVLDYGLQILCDLLKNLSQIYELGIHEKIAGLQAELKRIQDMPVGTE